MKKIVSAFLAISMAAALAGCAGGTTTESETVNTTAAETAAADTAAVAETTASADSAADESTAAEESAVAGTDESAAAAGEVMSYDEYIAADLDSQVTIQAYVQAKQSYYAEQSTATVYAQDQDGAYFLYDMACPEDQYDLLVPGTKIQVTGYKAEWSGEVEIIDASFEIIDDGDTYIATPLDVTDMLGTDDLINYQNQAVSFTGMTVEAAGQDADGNDVAFLYNYDGSGTEGDDLYFNASYNGQTYTFTIESYLCDETTDVYQAVKALEIGQTINMEGFLYWYEGVNPHITSVTVAE